MDAPTADVDIQCFGLAYLAKAEQVFMRPSRQYSWRQIVIGTKVQTESGVSRRMSAVGQNTFRGFHRINKALPGAKKAFIEHFVEQQAPLVGELFDVNTRNDLDQLSNRVCDCIRANLDNCSTSQLRSYNKVRKPVDLYVEHLVCMADELETVRTRLVPLLFLPLDSQILTHPGLFTEPGLAQHGLSRTSTYKDILAQRDYTELQHLLARKAEIVSEARHQPFHPIYFDLVWNNRYASSGGNLFETNP